MASYASGSGLAQFSSDGRGFGQGAYDRARQAGWTDQQIKSGLSSSGLSAGSAVAQRLGISSGGGGGGFSTMEGSMVNSGMQGLMGLANKYAGNSTLSNLVVGKMADTFSTQANMGLDLNYQKAMAGTMADIQYGLENLRAGNAMSLVAAEGAINKDIAKLQSETALGVGKLNLEGNKYTADKSLQATMYSSDRSLDGAKYVADEATRRVRVQGDEDRKTLGENTLQTLRLRNDARRTIRSQGSRFYS
jgi:hypothetical protein